MVSSVRTAPCDARRSRRSVTCLPRFLVQSGLDPRGMVRFFRKLDKIQPATSIPAEDKVRCAANTEY